MLQLSLAESRSLSCTPFSSWALRCFLWLCLCCASSRFQSKCDIEHRACDVHVMRWPWQVQCALRATLWARAGGFSSGRSSWRDSDMAGDSAFGICGWSGQLRFHHLGAPTLAGLDNAIYRSGRLRCLAKLAACVTWCVPCWPKLHMALHAPT